MMDQVKLIQIFGTPRESNFLEVTKDRYR